MGVRFRLSNRMDLVACGTCGRNFNQDALTRHAPICKKNAKKKPRKQFDSQKNRLVGTEVNINDLKRKEKKGPTAKEQRAADRKNNWKAKHEELIRNIRAARGESDPEPSYGQRGGGSGRDRGQSYGGGYGGSYGNDYGAQPSYSSKPSNGYGSSRHNSYNNNNYGYDDSPPARTGYGSSASKIPGPKAVPPGYMNCSHCGRNFAEETAERHIPWCAEQQKRKAVKQGNPAKQSAAQKMAARTQYKPPKPTSKRTSTSGGSSGYGQASSGYGPGGSYSQGYSQKQNSNSYFDDDLLGQQQQRLVAPSAGRRATKQSALANLNRDRSAGA